MIINDLHNSALELADRAFYYKSLNELEKALQYFGDALLKERQAAILARDQKIGEPTESILFRSAASLALNSTNYDEAIDLVLQGLLGAPPAEIASELWDLYYTAISKMELESNTNAQVVRTRIKEAPIEKEKYNREIPEGMLLIIKSYSATSEMAGIASGIFGPASDLVTIVPTWIGMTIGLADKAGQKISEQKARKIAIGVATGAGTFMAGTKIASKVVAWLASPFILPGIAINAALNSSFTYAYGRAISRFFLQNTDTADTEVIVKTVIALIGADLGFTTPYDSLI